MLSLPQASKNVIQRHTRKYHRWLQYTCAMVHKKCEQTSFLPSDEKSSEGVDSYPINSCHGVLKYLLYSPGFKNTIDHLKCLFNIRVLFAPERHIGYQLMSRKQCIYCHASRQFLLSVWPLQYVRCHTFVPLTSVRSFCCFTNDPGLREDIEIKKDVIEKTITDMQEPEEMVLEQITCDTTTQNTDVLSERHLKMLAKLLHCSVEEMKDLTVRYNFFRHLSPELIRTKVDIMVTFGLPYSFISKNPRLLYQTSAKELYKRLQQFEDHSFLDENSVLTLDDLAHYLECRNDYFPYVFKKLCAEKDALEGCSDQVSYIQFRLKCSKTQAEKLTSSYPLVRHVSNVKLKSLLDFFLNETNLNADFVINHRRLMSFSVARLQSRWKVIQLEGVFSDVIMLHIFNMSQREFDQTYGES